MDQFRFCKTSSDSGPVGPGLIQVLDLTGSDLVPVRFYPGFWSFNLLSWKRNRKKARAAPPPQCPPHAHGGKQRARTDCIQKRHPVNVGPDRPNRSVRAERACVWGWFCCCEGGAPRNQRTFNDRIRVLLRDVPKQHQG